MQGWMQESEDRLKHEVTFAVDSPKLVETKNGLPILKFDVQFYLDDEPFLTCLGWRLRAGEIEGPSMRTGNGWFCMTRVHSEALLQAIYTRTWEEWGATNSVPASLWAKVEKVAESKGLFAGTRGSV